MEFTNRAAYSPTDAAYYDRPEDPSVERAIVPLNELGITVVEKDPMTGGNIIQNVDAAIRSGAGSMQLVFNQGHHSAMGGRPKAYGKEVRESLRELIRANNVKIEGAEMPVASMSNMSGFNGQQGSMSEQQRRNDIQEVKDAIKFMADVAGGGAVDILSQEFARDIINANWNKDKKFEAFEEEEKFATAYVVDERTGRVQGIAKGQPIYEPVYRVAEKEEMGQDIYGKPHEIKPGDWVTEDGEYINPEDPQALLRRVPKWNNEIKEFEVQAVTWEEMEKKKADYNKRFNTDYTTEEFAIRTQLDNRIIQTKGQSLYYSRGYNDSVKRLEAFKKSLKYYEELESKMPKEELWRIMREDPILSGAYTSGEQMLPSEIIKGQIEDLRHNLKHIHEAASAADAQAMEIIEQKNNMKALSRYALNKSVKSYAELGIEAMKETELNKHCKNPIHVGPEIGWPTSYGGHPEEFVKLIEKSRKEMAEQLVQQGYDKADAMERAKRHIKGTMDTSHMGMWINHFKKKDVGETEEQRVGRFKKWYMEMMEMMAKKDVIGGIQVVDSASGAHGHLPVGQGFLGKTVVDAVDILKAHGWHGFVVSEGHEEEQFGKGRILLQTWREFGGGIGSGFFDEPQSWKGIEGTYLGHSNPPPYILGAYAPSDEYRGNPFWSGLPLD